METEKEEKKTKNTTSNLTFELMSMLIEEKKLPKWQENALKAHLEYIDGKSIPRKLFDEQYADFQKKYMGV